MNTFADSLRSDHSEPLPPLSQSRYGDMACETLYVRKHVQCAKVGESEPAARGIEIHQILASYINHLVRARRSTNLEVFDALTHLTRRRSVRRNFTSRWMRTSSLLSIRAMPEKWPATRGRLTW